MKKLLLSVVIGVVVVGAANAGIKETCLANSDKVVWVEETQRCVPINTCKANDQSIVDSYCNKVFKNVQLSVQDKSMARDIITAYMERNGRGASCKNTNILGTDGFLSTLKEAMVGQNYVACYTSRSGYIVFEFDDLYDATHADVRKGVAEAACIVYGGTYDADFGSSGKKGVCSRIRTASDCTNIGNLISKVRGIPASVEYGENGCKILVEE